MRQLGRFLFLLLLSCQGLNGESQRARQAKNAGDNPILIGVVWPKSAGDHFWKGLELAHAELSDVIERSLHLKKEKTDGSLHSEKKAAQALSDDPNVTAVIGHRGADAAKAVSILYEYTDMVMIAPGTSSPKITRAGFERIFRTLPTDEAFGAALATHASQLGLHRILIVYANTPYGRAVANAFESRADAIPTGRLDILHRLSFDRGGLPAFERALRSIDAAKAGAVLLAATQADAQALIKTLRTNSVSAPILAPVALDQTAPTIAQAKNGAAPTATEVTNTAGNVGTVATVFEPSLKTSSRFVQSFTKKYGHPPDTWAAQAYQALKLLVSAIESAKSTVPSEISKALRRPKGYQTINGPLRFNGVGAAIEPKIVFRQLIKAPVTKP